MALEVNASKVVNTVTFKVDSAALSDAKKAIKSVKDYAEGLQPSLNMTKFKQQMREMEKIAKRVAAANRKALNGGGGPPIPPVPPRPPRGGGGGGRPPRGGGGPGGAASRADTAALRRENFNYRSSQFGKADAGVRNSARTIVNDMIAAYEKEQVSIARVNQTIAHQMDILRASHREKMSDIEAEVSARRREKRELERIARLNQRIAAREEAARARAARRSEEEARRERQRKLERLRDGGLSLNPRMLAGGLLGAAAFEGIGRIRETLNTTAERNNLIGQGAKNIQANPNSILALSTWGQENGVDSANVKKAIDNLKDVRERLGNSAMNSVLDPKTGKYKGGDSGINDIMNQFGWTPDMVKKYQNNPLDFVGATVNEGQRRGMNSAQIGRLMENLGDDLMHYQRMFENSGEQFKQTLDQLSRTGASLSDTQIEAAHQYSVMSRELGLIGDGLDNKFLDGFMDGMDPDTVRQFQDALASLGPDFVSLGHAVGGATAELMRLTTWAINFMHGPVEQSASQASTQIGEKQAALPQGSAAQTAVGMGYTGQWLYNLLFPEANAKSATSLPVSSIGGGWSPSSLLSGVAMQQGSVMGLSANVMLPSDLFSITINPSESFGNILEATISQKVQFQHQSLILDMNSATSANASN